jgi:2-polyprenyl-3-methyl-5-hydroxy-6-metoxy-1,4-benzoquinol methylase
MVMKEETPAETRNTDLDWEKVAAENPYWGVLSAEQYKGHQLSPSARELFFKSGEELVSNVVAFIQSHINAEFQPQRSLDFGCGVGRLLIPMARRSKQAVGVDVSQQMLALCNENLVAFGIKNATTIQGDDTLSGVSGTFNFINTYIVLQHIPPARGYELLGRLLSKLDAGGAASIQLTYGKHRKFFVHEASRAQYYRRDGRILFDIGPPVFTPPVGTITMYDYDLNHVASVINEIAGSPVLMLPTNDDDHLGVHFIFVRGR